METNTVLIPYCLKLALLVSTKASIVAMEVVALSMDNFNRSASCGSRTDGAPPGETITRGNSKNAPGHTVSIAEVKALASTNATSGSGATKMSCNWIVAVAGLGDMTVLPFVGLPCVPACKRSRHSSVRLSAESPSQICKATDIATHA